ncbi:hypothetical protein CHS0354_031231 [Potamilus streckersoni]|uniref:Uncharacterized protein n=1 Tax=Potamilus streckersoni TaxID=2493646 RepID=A0AAE0RM49_9BIVA|nr:hypothetical protein CHS0354_031231 [Potamilus streckersoni]
MGHPDREEFMSFAGHPNNVTVVNTASLVDFSLLSVSRDISVWDLREKSSKCIKTLSSSGLTQNGPVNFFSTTRQIDLTPGDHVADIVINPSGDLIYGATGNVVRVWDLRTTQLTQPMLCVQIYRQQKLSGGHQAAIMVLAVDHKEDSDILVTGSKDHYIKQVKTTNILIMLKWFIG